MTFSSHFCLRWLAAAGLVCASALDHAAAFEDTMAQRTQACTACHSADYIITQPRGLPDPMAFWTAEVNKMRHSYGAPVEESDVQAIVAYLVATYRQ